jgi:hypothetical protein
MTRYFHKSIHHKISPSSIILKASVQSAVRFCSPPLTIALPAGLDRCSVNLSHCFRSVLGLSMFEHQKSFRFAQSNSSPISLRDLPSISLSIRTSLAHDSKFGCFADGFISKTRSRIQVAAVISSSENLNFDFFGVAIFKSRRRSFNGSLTGSKE